MDYDMNRWRKLVVGDRTKSNPWSHLNELLVAANTRNSKRGGKRDLNGDDAAEVQ